MSNRLQLSDNPKIRSTSTSKSTTITHSYYPQSRNKEPSEFRITLNCMDSRRSARKHFSTQKLEQFPSLFPIQENVRSSRRSLTRKTFQSHLFDEKEQLARGISKNLLAFITTPNSLGNNFPILKEKEIAPRDLLQECKLIMQKPVETQAKRSESSQKLVLKAKYPGYKKYLCSKTSADVVKVFGVNSYKGLFKETNEDKVTILLNISKPSDFKGEWPSNISFFGLFDGYNGTGCSNFLRDKAHLYIIKSPFFPSNIEEAIRDGLSRLDKDFLSNHAVNYDNYVIDESGADALIVLIINSKAYIFNVGNSKAILSLKGGKKTVLLSKEGSERDARLEAKRGVSEEISKKKTNNFSGRSFGNAELKVRGCREIMGADFSNVEIAKIEVDKDKMDYIFLGSRGIFWRCEYSEISEIIWNSFNCKGITESTPHTHAGVCADAAIKLALANNSRENLTGILIGFRGFMKAYEKKKEKMQKRIISSILNRAETENS